MPKYAQLQLVFAGCFLYCAVACAPTSRCLTHRSTGNSAKTFMAMLRTAQHQSQCGEIQAGLAWRGAVAQPVLRRFVFLICSTDICRRLSCGHLDTKFSTAVPTAGSRTVLVLNLVRPYYSRSTVPGTAANKDSRVPVIYRILNLDLNLVSTFF